MDGSFQFSLSDEHLNMDNCADPAVWTQDRAGLLERVVAELAWATRLFTKTKNLAHSLEEWTTFDNLFNFCKLFYILWI